MENTKNQNLTPYTDVRVRTYVFYDPYFTNRQLVVVNRLVDILYAVMTLSYSVCNCSNEHEHSVFNYQYMTEKYLAAPFMKVSMLSAPNAIM